MDGVWWSGRTRRSYESQLNPPGAGADPRLSIGQSGRGSRIRILKFPCLPNERDTARGRQNVGLWGSLPYGIFQMNFLATQKRIRNVVRMHMRICAIFIRLILDKRRPRRDWTDGRFSPPPQNSLSDTCAFSYALNVGYVVATALPQFPRGVHMQLGTV